jgi:hemerythrin superfamily protein
VATDTRDRYEQMSREELYELAQQRDIPGRSDKTKEELVAALELADRGPDAVELLTEQHDRIRALFEEFESLSSRPSKRKDELADLLITHLVKHAEVEELVFYPAVRSEMEGFDDEVDEDLEEHHAAELLLWELDKMTSADERFDAKVKVLKELVIHHLEEEENELFPEVREAIDEGRRRELGAAMVRAHKIAPSRPHPLSPDEPPANFLAGLPGAGYDAAKGLLRYGKRTLLRR